MLRTEQLRMTRLLVTAAEVERAALCARVAELRGLLRAAVGDIEWLSAASRARGGGGGGGGGT